MEAVSLEKLRCEGAGRDAIGMLQLALETFGGARIALASSFSDEDQVLTHMLIGLEDKPRIFTLDTGRHFQQTYDVMQRSMELYGIAYEVLAPDGWEIEQMVQRHGPNLFYSGVELRKHCCEVRKTRPLKRVLSTVDAWICGLRRSQSVTREAVEAVEWDSLHGNFKINPLFDWTAEQVQDYMDRHNIPSNELYRQGFSSIGCAPCTRAITPGEDVRAGRWWWEEPQHKECGLHRRPNNQTEKKEGE